MSMPVKKNDNQKRIYEFIKSYINEKSYPPSVREICAAVGLSSTSTVHGHLARLDKKGLIKRDPTKPRTIEIVEKDAKKEMINIPVLGTITAGLPILAEENIEDIFPLPIEHVRSNKELFMLHVKGDSMIEAGIHNGDLAVIEKDNYAENGTIVVALIDNEATLKRFFKEKDHIRLQPENSTMSPIIVDSCTILGKLVGLYREY
jgi:repressor LexA